MYTDNYVEKSLELHLFFARIMKEHSLFLKAGFTPANPDFSEAAGCFKEEFEEVLRCALTLTGGTVSRQVQESAELVTEFTMEAEKQTEEFTCIQIDRNITAEELQLKPAGGCHSRDERAMDCDCDCGCGGSSGSDRDCGSGSGGCNRPEPASWQMHYQIRRLNQRALQLLDGLIALKERILQEVLDCTMFTMNYPLLLEHILREARLYRQYIETLEKNGCLMDQDMAATECFWNQIMMEHALFIRGLLDPSEANLIRTANQFAGQYEELLQACNTAQPFTMPHMASSEASMELPEASLAETLRFRDFKAAGTEGIQNCEIRSIILPLLADHVLREANHYIRLLQS